jgi:hypothetical protein
MAITPQIVTFAPSAPPEYRPQYTQETFKVGPAIAGRLSDYLKQNPSQILFAGTSRAPDPAGVLAAANLAWSEILKPQSGPAAGAKVEDRKPTPALDAIWAGLRAGEGAKAGFGLGAPLVIGRNLKTYGIPVSRFAVPPIPEGLISPGPIVGASTKQAKIPVTIPSSVLRATQAVSYLEVFRDPVEEFAKTHPGLDTPLDFVGFVVATPRAWDALLNPGSRSRIEVFLIVGQAVVSLLKALADVIPWLQHAKPVLVWSGVILKGGDQLYAIVNKPEGMDAAAGTTARLSGQRQRLS